MKWKRKLLNAVSSYMNEGENVACAAGGLVLLEGGKFDEANSITGAMLNEFKRK